MLASILLLIPSPGFDTAAPALGDVPGDCAGNVLGQELRPMMNSASDKAVNLSKRILIDLERRIAEVDSNTEPLDGSLGRALRGAVPNDDTR